MKWTGWLRVLPLRVTSIVVVPPPRAAARGGGVCSLHTILLREGSDASTATMAGGPFCPCFLLILFMVLSSRLCVLAVVFPSKCDIEQLCMIELEQLS